MPNKPITLTPCACEKCNDAVSPEINKLVPFKTALYKSKLLIIGNTKKPGSNFLRLANKFLSRSLFPEEKNN